MEGKNYTFLYSLRKNFNQYEETKEDSYRNGVFVFFLGGGIKGQY